MVETSNKLLLTDCDGLSWVLGDKQFLCERRIKACRLWEPPFCILSYFFIIKPGEPCDGTLREPASGAKFIQHPLDQRIISGADKGVTHAHTQGWTIIAISNQAGVEAGFKTLEDAIAESHYTLELFPQIQCAYICPDFEGRHCWMIGRGHDEIAVHLTSWGEEFIGTFRKPQPGMLSAAIKMSGSPDSKSAYWFVGDRPEDDNTSRLRAESGKLSLVP